MRISLPALIAACWVTIAIAPNAAIAGNAPVALPDSGSGGLSDTFSPHGRLLNGTVAASRISSELSSSLQSLQRRQLVTSLNGRTLSLSSDQVSVIATAFSSNSRAGSLQALEQQLKGEMNGLDIRISSLDLSPSALAKAIESSNKLVADLSGEQLESAIESPTFMALLQMLSAANQAVDDKVATTASQRNDVMILKMSLR